MKHIMLIALVLVLAMSMLFHMACADSPIQLPSGLEFGMNMEQAVGVSGYYSSGDSLPDQAFLQANGYDLAGYIQGGATVGGLDASVKGYFVDGGLKKMQYTFEHVEVPGSHKGVEETCQKSFDQVDAALQKKYGPALAKSEARHQYQTLKSYSWYYKMTRERAYLGQYPSSTYIVPVGDEGTIYIDHFVVVDQLTPHPTDNSAMAQYCSSHMLTYTYYDYQINPEADTSSVVDF